MVCILLCMLIKLSLFAMTSAHPPLYTLFPPLTVNPLVSAKMHHFAYLQYWKPYSASALVLIHWPSTVVGIFKLFVGAKADINPLLLICFGKHLITGN